jgi:hypothetical protein
VAQIVANLKQAELGIPRRTCRVTRLNRGAYRYSSHKNPSLQPTNTSSRAIVIRCHARGLSSTLAGLFRFESFDHDSRRAT